MNKAPFFTAAAFAMLSLSACNNKPEVVDTRSPDPQASAIANAAPVELPPAIAATVTLRCQPGNTLLYADFFQGDKMVVIKETKDGAPKMLKAPTAGEPYVGEGSWKLTGTSKSATIVLGDGSSHSCKS